MNKTKQIEILCEHHGEISGTAYTPIAEWKGQVDLKTTEYRLYSDDDWRKVECYRYKVIKVTVPAWMTADELIKNSTGYSYVYSFGAPMDWDREMIDFLLTVDCTLRYSIIKLLKTKKIKSEFRLSLRNQIMDWIKNPENRKYTRPLSDKQINVLVKYDRLDAKRTSGQIYRDHRCHEFVGFESIEVNRKEVRK